jgi:hypothetical protein
MVKGKNDIMDKVALNFALQEGDVGLSSWKEKVDDWKSSWL